MAKKIRKCRHCNAVLLSTRRNAQWCNASACQLARKRATYAKKYKRQPRVCKFCGCDVTDLWPKRICKKKSCLKQDKEKKRLARISSRKRYAARLRAGSKGLRQTLNSHTTSDKKISVKDEDYFDHSMYIVEQKKYKKPNGRRCQDCNIKLFGSFRKRCPACFKSYSNTLGGISEQYS